MTIYLSYVGALPWGIGLRRIKEFQNYVLITQLGCPRIGFGKLLVQRHIM